MSTSVQILEDIAADPAHETFELMCHPAKMDHELREISDYNDKRTDELAILQDQSIAQYVERLEYPIDQLFRTLKIPPIKHNPFKKVCQCYNITNKV